MAANQNTSVFGRGRASVRVPHATDPSAPSVICWAENGLISMLDERTGQTHVITREDAQARAINIYVANSRLAKTVEARRKWDQFADAFDEVLREAYVQGMPDDVGAITDREIRRPKLFTVSSPEATDGPKKKLITNL